MIKENSSTQFRRSFSPVAVARRSSSAVSRPAIQAFAKASVENRKEDSPTPMYGIRAQEIEAFPMPAENGNDQSKDVEIKPYTTAPVQRKVGLEIETPTFELYPGRMKPEPKRKEPKRKESKRNKQDEYSILINSDEEEDGYGERSLPFETSDHQLEKGKAILSGTGWKLTADIIGGQGIIEFITDPVDETNQPTELGNIARRIETEARRVRGLVAAQGYIQLARNIVLRRLPGALEGNIHITGGIKPDKIIDLLQQVATWDGTNDLNVDESSRAILGQAVNAAQDPLGTIAGQGAAYQGLVALLGSYVAGQRRYRLMANEAHETIMKYRDYREDFYRIQYCANARNIEEFMRTGDITGSDKHIARQYEEEGKEGFFSELRAVLRELITPRAAKMMVPVLSRSSLSELKDKAQMPAAPVFRADVMTAAGEPGGNAATPLFPLGLDTPGHAGRTIEATPDITVAQWLQSIYNGQNLKFSDETKDFEKVGPSNVPCFCGLMTTREKGAVMEIRALDGEQLVAANRWGHLADTVSQAFVALNQ